MREVLGVVREKGERRNAYLNLAYTGPLDNTKLQGEITFAKVSNIAMDLFCDTSKAASAGGAKAASAGGATTETEKSCQQNHSFLEVVDGLKEKPWKIPAHVDEGFELPI